MAARTPHHYEYAEKLSCQRENLIYVQKDKKKREKYRQIHIQTESDKKARYDDEEDKLKTKKMMKKCTYIPFCQPASSLASSSSSSGKLGVVLQIEHSIKYLD